jgi:glycosyltransferase involved in cell wall biosynthesis
MKIAQCHHNQLRYAAGGEVFLSSLARYLSQRHHVEIHTLPILQDGNGLNLSPSLPSSVRVDEAFYHDIDADVCYVIYAPMLSFIFHTKAPKIAGFHSHHISFHSFVPSLSPIVNSAVLADLFLRNYSVRHYEAVHVNNQQTLRSIKHKNKYFIPNPIDDTVFQPRCKKEPKTLLYVGRHSAVKGWDVFLRIAKELQPKGYTAFYTGPDEQIEFALPVKETANPYLLSQAYSRCSVLISPAMIDTFGNVLVESLLCGTPAITTPTPVHKGLGLPLYYASTPSEFISQIEKISQNHVDGNYLRQSAMKYSLSHLGPKYEEMFRRVASR